MDAQHAAVVGGPYLVVRIVWAGIPPEACFGPWVMKDDMSHLKALEMFVQKWRDKHGEPLSVTIYSVLAPGEIDGLQMPSEL